MSKKDKDDDEKGEKAAEKAIEKDLERETRSAASRSLATSPRATKELTELRKWFLAEVGIRSPQQVIDGLVKKFGELCGDPPAAEKTPDGDVGSP